MSIPREKVFTVKSTVPSMKRERERQRDLVRRKSKKKSFDLNRAKNFKYINLNPVSHLVIRKYICIYLCLYSFFLLIIYINSVSISVFFCVSVSVFLNAAASATTLRSI